MVLRPRSRLLPGPPAVGLGRESFRRPFPTSGGRARHSRISSVGRDRGGASPKTALDWLDYDPTSQTNYGQGQEFKFNFTSLKQIYIEGDRFVYHVDRSRSGFGETEQPFPGN